VWVWVDVGVGVGMGLRMECRLVFSNFYRLV